MKLIALTGLFFLSTWSVFAGDERMVIVELKDKLPEVTRVKGTNCVNSYFNETNFLTIKHDENSIVVSVEAVGESKKTRTMSFYLGSDEDNYGEVIQKKIVLQDEIYVRTFTKNPNKSPVTAITQTNYHSVHAKEMVSQANGSSSRIIKVSNYNQRNGEAFPYYERIVNCTFTY